LFVLARKLSKDLKAQEVKWIPEKLDWENHFFDPNVLSTIK
jgi:hypothetical protein